MNLCFADRSHSDSTVPREKTPPSMNDNDTFNGVLGTSALGARPTNEGGDGSDAGASASYAKKAGARQPLSRPRQPKPGR